MLMFFREEAGASSPFKKSFHIVFVPRRSVLCEKKLKVRRLRTLLMIRISCVNITWIYFSRDGHKNQDCRWTISAQLHWSCGKTSACEPCGRWFESIRTNLLNLWSNPFKLICLTLWFNLTISYSDDFNVSRNSCWNLVHLLPFF